MISVSLILFGYQLAVVVGRLSNHVSVVVRSLSDGFTVVPSSLLDGVFVLLCGIAHSIPNTLLLNTHGPHDLFISEVLEFAEEKQD